MERESNSEKNPLRPEESIKQRLTDIMPVSQFDNFVNIAGHISRGVLDTLQLGQAKKAWIFVRDFV